MQKIVKEFSFRETNVKIISDKEKYFGIAFSEIEKRYLELEKFIKKNPLFQSSLEPLKVENSAPKIAKEMVKAGKIANVGPMAAVAGTIAEFAARKMFKAGAKIAVVENGGDIFAITKEPITIGIFAGEKLPALAFELNSKNTPLSVCSSSSYLGHSFSFGKCNLATIFAKNGSVCDAFATALCNSIKKEEDIQPALELIKKLAGNKIEGAIAVKNSKVGLIGNIPPLKKIEKKIEKKITKSKDYTIDKGIFLDL